MALKVSHYRGPYFSKFYGRKYMVEVYTSGKSKQLWLSRYLMQQKLGRELLNSEHVDHIDEDKTNDDIANLQILTKSENTSKHNESRGNLKGILTYLCPSCEKLFERKVKIVESNAKYNKTGPYCSKSCSSKGRKGLKYKIDKIR